MAKLSHLSQVFQLSGQTVMQRVCVISSLLIFLTCFTWTITPLLAQEVQEAQEAEDIGDEEANDISGYRGIDEEGEEGEM